MNFESQPESPLEVKKTPENLESSYNYPEVMELLKPAMLSLARQLKESIEKGEYQTLISDEVGARIPTLILRKLFKAKAPNAGTLQTHFLSLGRSNSDADSINKFFKNNKDKLGKVLFVTEFVKDGRTLVDFHFTISNFDVAVVSNYRLRAKDGSLVGLTVKEKVNDLIEKTNWRDEKTKDKKWNHEIFVGTDGAFLAGKQLHDFNGVKNRKRVDMNRLVWADPIDRAMNIIGAHPETVKNLLENPEADWKTLNEEGNKIQFDRGLREERFKVTPEKEEEIQSKIREKNKKKLSDSEISEINERVVKAREDVDTMTQEILVEVWGG